MKLFEVSSPVEAALRRVLLALTQVAEKPIKKQEASRTYREGSVEYVMGEPFQSDQWLLIFPQRTYDKAEEREISVKIGQRQTAQEHQKFGKADVWEAHNYPLQPDSFISKTLEALRGLRVRRYHYDVVSDHFLVTALVSVE